MFPKILHLTCKDKNNINNKIWINCYNKFKKIYTGYDIILYDDNDIYKIVKENFPNHEKIIRKVTNGGTLSDTFRYLILYLKGGIYADMDCEPLKHIDLLFNNFVYYHGNKGKFYLQKQSIDYHNIFKQNPCLKCEKLNNNFYNCKGHNLIHPELTSLIIGYEFSKYYGCYDKSAGQCCQWFIIAKPRLFLLKALYEQCIKNIDCNNHLKSVQASTGPIMFSQMINIYKNLHENHGIVIMPNDVFCVGSKNVPLTNNSFIKHHFTGEWRIEEDKRKMKPLAIIK